MAEAKKYSSKGPGWGMLKQVSIESMKTYVNEQLAPIKVQIAKIESDYDSLEKTLKQTEHKLDSRDMASQKRIDIIRERNEDLYKEAEKLKSGLTQTEALAKRAVKGVEENIRAIGKSIETRDHKLTQLEASLKAFVTEKTGPLYVQGRTINAKVDEMVTEISKYPVLLEDFKKEVYAKQKGFLAKLSDFGNTIIGVKAKQSETVNTMNKISADFSNHVGDFKSQVKSVEKIKGDFDHYVEQHRQVHSKQDADFANTKMVLNQHMANFDNHIVDYSLHKKPKEKKKAEAKKTLTRGHFATLFHKIDAKPRAK